MDKSIFVIHNDVNCVIGYVEDEATARSYCENTKSTYWYEFCPKINN